MEPSYLVNGKILPYSKAVLHINDLALLRGFGIFDFFRTSGARPFLLDEYLRRFMKSAELMGLNLNYSKEEISAFVSELIKKNGYPDTGIRMILTGGYTPDGYAPSDPNFLILIERLNYPSPEHYSEGVKLVTYPHLREWSEIKSINYLTPIKIRNDIAARGGYDVLYHHQGNILEVSRSNFFIIKDDVLITPSKNVLHGVTRKTTLRLAAEIMKVEERDISMDELHSAHETFLTGTTKRIMPVVKVDDIQIGDGKPGRHTRKLMQVFADFERSIVN